MKKTLIEIPDFLKYKYRHNGESWGDYKTELPDGKIFSKVVTIMRANPPHVNHTAMLRELCSKAVDVNINLGSSNKFDRKNPFKIEEREEMMNLALKSCKNYRLFRLPDVGNDDEWFENLCRINGNFTEILSNNPYDLRIYGNYQYEPGREGEERGRKYDIINPTDVIDQDKITYIRNVKKGNSIIATIRKPLYVSGTFVRASMVNGWNWENLVDPEVAKYIKKKDLIGRLRDFCPELIDMPLEKFDDGR